MCPVALLPHVLVHVPEPVDPALELDEVGGVRLHCEVHRGLGLVDDDGEPDGDGEGDHDDDLSVKHQATQKLPVFRQSGDITENTRPEQRVTKT